MADLSHPPVEFADVVDAYRCEDGNYQRSPPAELAMQAAASASFSAASSLCGEPCRTDPSPALRPVFFWMSTTADSNSSAELPPSLKVRRTRSTSSRRYGCGKYVNVARAIRPPLLGFSIEKTLTQHRRADFLGFSGGQGGGVALLQGSGQG